MLPTRHATRLLPGRFVNRGSATFAAAVWLSSCASPPTDGQAQAPRSPTPEPTKGVVRVETVARGLEHPWALAFLPDGRMLVTERPGRLRIVDQSGRISEPLAGVPQVQASGQGGLLDVALDPGFAANRLLYLSFAEPGEGGAGTAVARGRLGEGGLEEVRVIYRQQPKVEGGNHFGSRLAFTRDGKLFVTQGERAGYREQAQDLSNHLGKVVRIEADGSVPADNPFVGRAGVRPEIWSYGHRNMQAAAIHPETGQLWTVEHGARGGDELNHPEAGKNYGWPVITYGVDYSGRQDRRGHGEGRHGAAGLLLGSGDRAIGDGVLHRRRLPWLEGERARRLAQAGRWCGSSSKVARSYGRSAIGRRAGRADSRRAAGAGWAGVRRDRRGEWAGAASAAGRGWVTELQLRVRDETAGSGPS